MPEAIEKTQQEPVSDGRRQRSHRSRQKIAEAMIGLIMEGKFNPSAEAVAERAGVGLRSVFRHFKDMESLFREVSALMHADLDPVLSRPPEGKTWQDRLDTLIGQRCAMYEHIMPMRKASEAQKYRSPFVREEMARNAAALRKRLVEVLPENITGDQVALDALDVTLSAMTWIQLREDQKLSPAKAEATVRHMVSTLIKQHA